MNLKARDGSYRDDGVVPTSPELFSESQFTDASLI